MEACLQVRFTGMLFWLIRAVRGISGEHLVKYHAQTIQIRSSIDRFPYPLFGTHILRTAHGNPRCRQLRTAIHELGDTKVGQHRRSIPTEQNVHGFDITVYNALGQQVYLRDEKGVRAGKHSLEVTGADWVPGVYLYRIVTSNRVITGRMVKR